MTNNYHLKIQLIKKELHNILRSKKRYHAKFITYRKLDLRIRLIVNVCNAITLSTIVLNLIQYQFFIYASLAFSFISTITGVIYSTLDLPVKIQSSNTTYLQMSDLHSNYTAILVKNGLSSADCDGILTELNQKLGLIYDSSLPIEISTTKSAIIIIPENEPEPRETVSGMVSIEPV